MELEQLKPNVILRGSLFNEPVQVIAVVPLGASIKVIGTGLKTGLTHEPILTPEQLATLEVSSDQKSYDGDSLRFRLGVEAMRLGSPTSTTRTSPSPSPASIRCRTSLRRSTTTSSSCRASASCWPTTPAPARRSWPGCCSRS